MKLQSKTSEQANTHTKFRKIRTKLKISQEIVASKIGVPQSVVHYKETGQNTITAKDVYVLETFAREKNNGKIPDDLFEDFVDLYCSIGEIPPYSEPEPEQFKEFVRLCMREGKEVFEVITNLDKYISPTEASRILKLSRQRVNILANEGKIKGNKIGNSWLLDKESVLSYKSLPRKAGRPSKKGK